jgi:hypothetical protein
MAKLGDLKVEVTVDGKATPELEALIRRLVREELANALTNVRMQATGWQEVKPWPPVERK